MYFGHSQLPKRHVSKNKKKNVNQEIKAFFELSQKGES